MILIIKKNIKDGKKRDINYNEEFISNIWNCWKV